MLYAKAQAFVPGHITGFFRIYDDCENPLYCGSKGAGFSITAGTTTTVTMTVSNDNEILVKYNGKVIDAPVTTTVIQNMLIDYEKTAQVVVEHNSQLPIGVGFGASGAGALGVAIALGNLLDDSVSLQQVAQYAHVAEVENRTGLGDVIAQTVGGVEIRLQPGAPGIGKVKTLPFSPKLKIVLAGSSGIETKAILSNKESRKRINRVADHILDKVLENPSLERIIRCSIEFANFTGLMTPKVRAALTELWDEGFEMSSMVMLGDSIFTVCKQQDVPKVRQIMQNYWHETEILVTSISECGGGLT